MRIETIKEVLAKCDGLINKANKSFVRNLLIFKYLNDCFDQERNIIKQDFLIRGICEVEAKQLIEEHAYYNVVFIPVCARWNTLKQASNIHESISTAIEHILESNPNIHLPIKYENGNNDIDDFTTIALMTLIEVLQFEAIVIQEEWKVIEHWLNEVKDV
ncbi:hypothetical protein NG54_11035 [Heyndrickxia ginsengihumi]|uniref:N6 adenine-specific DNA methyltransferase N-terminal domain-containing protein n=1 Tax=Heyndrickxia ginsengihumi TaxID=363870 RepID=A0A0A6VA64_9BACI|nr:type I restriction-modification system subunit M N-terminal domain-containing protein [Heyndrickxia ginsengihumi]KHD85115.1 hypothetical protein NG54_11035 [Heyndrickxia ginsengihumi]